jgi:hypothetical protein
LLVVSCHASLWVGDTFSDYRDTPDARRAHALLMFVLEATIRSRNVACFETVYDSVCAGVGLKRPTFLRLWVFLASDERTDAFNAQAQALTTPPDVSEKHKRKRGDEPAPMGAHLISTPSELVRCLVQQRLSHADESMSLTFDHAGSAVDLDAFDVDDAGEEVDFAAEDPGSSLVHRLSAANHFSHSVVQLSAKANRMADADRELTSYVITGDNGMPVFDVSDAERLQRLRVVDARVQSSAQWMHSSDQLLRFMHPHHQPTHHELTQWLFAQASVVGIPATEIERMGHADLEAQIQNVMLSPALYAPIPKIVASCSSGASTWSDCRYAEVYPANATWMAKCRDDTAIVERAIQAGQLPPDETQHNVEHVLSELALVVARPLKGWPPNYALVRDAALRDMLKFNETVSGADVFGKATSLNCMFPAAADIPDTMSCPTFFMLQFVEMQRCEFGLDRPQTHMNTVIYPWSFVLLVPAFGWPGSIQARGPPGSGKGESKKRLQPCVNTCLWFNVDSVSAMGTTYGGLPEQCFWDSTYTRPRFFCWC